MIATDTLNHPTTSSTSTECVLAQSLLPNTAPKIRESQNTRPESAVKIVRRAFKEDRNWLRTPPPPLPRRRPRNQGIWAMEKEEWDFWREGRKGYERTLLEKGS